MSMNKVAILDEAPEKSPIFALDQVPLYYQLQSILTEQIVSGMLAPGDQLPIEFQLEQQYGVSRVTVRQALAAMEKAGLIRREAGRGTFVSEARPHPLETLQLQGSMDELISLGQTTTVKMLYVKTVQATAKDAEQLGIRPGDNLIRCARIRIYRKEPYSYVLNDLPYEIGVRLSKTDWKHSISQALQEKLRIPLVEAKQSIRASLADAQLARLLSTRIGAPLLSVDRLVMTTDHRPVTRVRTSYRSDIFQFNVHLRKDKPNGDWNFKRKQ